MLIQNQIKAVLRAHNISLNVERDYSATELITLYEKVIIFMDRKIQKIKAAEAEIVEKPCTTNLEELADTVTNEFDTLGFDSVLKKYTPKYLATLHTDEVYTIAETFIKTCRQKGYPIDQIWPDIMANYGVIPRTYGV